MHLQCIGVHISMNSTNGSACDWLLGPPLMTFPRVESDLLMAAPSFSRSPVAPVESARSLTQEGRKNGQGCMVTTAQTVLNA